MLAVRAKSQAPGQAAATNTTAPFTTALSPPLPPTPYGVRGWTVIFGDSGLPHAYLRILPASPIFSVSQSRHALADAAHAAIARQLSL